MVRFRPEAPIKCGCSSSGRAPPCQGGGSGFEPRHPLQKISTLNGCLFFGLRIGTRSRALRKCSGGAFLARSAEERHPKTTRRKKRGRSVQTLKHTSSAAKEKTPIRGLNLGIFYNKNILSDNLQVKTTQHYIIRCMLCGFFIIQHLMRMFYC